MKNRQRSGSITVYCKQCQETFQSPPSRIKHGHSVFCCRACSSAWKAVHYKGRSTGYAYPCGPANPKWKGIRNPKPCPICGTVFSSANKTCSQACGRKLQGSQKTGSNNPWAKRNPPKIKYCLKCGKKYYRGYLGTPTSGLGKYYCSSDCSVQSQCNSQRQLFIAKQLTYRLNEPVILEKTWDWLRSPLSKQKLRVDIWLPKRRVAIEYHGAQHFNPEAFSHGKVELEDIQKRDKSKYEQLTERKIPLIVLSGWPIDMNQLIDAIASIPGSKEISVLPQLELFVSPLESLGR